jgi:hypothetical protein
MYVDEYVCMYVLEFIDTFFLLSAELTPYEYKHTERERHMLYIIYVRT